MWIMTWIISTITAEDERCGYEACTLRIASAHADHRSFSEESKLRV